MSAASSISRVAARLTRAVGGDQVARLDEDDVAGHQLLGVDLDRLAVAAHPGDRLHHLRERLDALLGLGLLAQADHGVEDREPGQHDGRAGVAGDDLVDEGRAQEDDLHEVLVLTQEGPPARLLLAGGQPVRTVRRQPGPRLLGREPRRGIDPELARHLVDLGGHGIGRAPFRDRREVLTCHRCLHESVGSDAPMVVTRWVVPPHPRRGGRAGLVAPRPHPSGVMPRPPSAWKPSGIRPTS